MDALASLDLRIDNHEQLRIMSAETEESSRELSQKITNLLENLQKLQERLIRTGKLLEDLEEQVAKARTINVAANILRISKAS